MPKFPFLAALATLALCTLAARADTADDLRSAIQKLADAPNYSWTTTSKGGIGQQTTEGKSEKDGFTLFTVSAVGDTYTAVLQSNRVLVKTGNGWKTAYDLQKINDDAGGFSPEGLLLLQVQGFKPPAAQLTSLFPTLQHVAKADTGFTADLPSDYAKDLLTFRFPGASAAASKPAPPDKFQPMLPSVQLLTVKNPRGTLQVTLKNGAIAQYEMHVTGTIVINDEDKLTERTITVQIADVGSTSVAVPEEARNMLAQNPTGTRGR